jgi:hypothetical protein
MEFLLQENWPSLGQGNHSELTKKLHDWCGKISSYVVTLSERVNQLEKREETRTNEIKNLKCELEKANNSVKSANISNEWVQIVTKGSKNAKKPSGGYKRSHKRTE